MKLIKVIKSELIKLKYPPIFWLIGFVLFTTLAVVFSAHYIDIHKTVSLGVNPWTRINTAGQAIFSMFVGTPFIVLLISAVLFIEHQNRGFKQLYTLPKSRLALVIYKIIALFLCLIFSVVLLIIGIICVGYILNVIYPETEFSYYELPVVDLLKSFVLIFISFLGVIGIQFFLSLRFKGFLVPASFGILAYVVGLILSSINNPLSFYFPYCYPFIARDLGVFNNSELGIESFGILNEVELYSVGVFLVFMMLSLFMERGRDV